MLIVAAIIVTCCEMLYIIDYIKNISGRLKEIHSKCILTADTDTAAAIITHIFLIVLMWALAYASITSSTAYYGWIFLLLATLLAAFWLIDVIDSY